MNSLLSLVASPKVQLRELDDIESFDVDESQFATAFVKLTTASLPEADPSAGFGSPEAFFGSVLIELGNKHQDQVKRTIVFISPLSDEWRATAAPRTEPRDYHPTDFPNPSLDIK